jgi:hypothetical protein
MTVPPHMVSRRGSGARGAGYLFRRHGKGRRLAQIGAKVLVVVCVAAIAVAVGIAWVGAAQG